MMLCFDIIREAGSEERRLEYFLFDGTATIASERRPVLNESGVVMKPKDFEIGAHIFVQGKQWQIVDASRETRRYYSRFGQPLAQRLTPQQSGTVLHFYGNDLVLDFWPGDTTVEIRVGSSNHHKHPRDERDYGHLTLWMSRCKPVVTTFDGKREEPSADLFFRAARAGKRINVAGRECELHSWDTSTEAFRLKRRDHHQHGEGNEERLETLRFKATFTGLVRGGYSQRDASRRIVVTVYPEDGTIDARFEDEDDFLVLKRMLYATTTDPKQQRQRTVVVADFVAGGIVTFELPKSRVTILALRILGPANRDTEQCLDHAEHGRFEGLVGPEQPSILGEDNDELDHHTGVAVAFASCGGNLDCAKSLASLVLRIVRAKVDARGLVLELEKKRKSQTQPKKDDDGKDRIKSLVRALETAAFENEAAEARTRKKEPLDDDSVAIIAQSFQSYDDTDFVDMIGLAALGALQRCIDEDAPETTFLGARLARRVAAHAVTPISLRRVFREGPEQTRRQSLIDRDCRVFLNVLENVTDYDALCDRIYRADFSALEEKKVRVKKTAAFPENSKNSFNVLPKGPPDAAVLGAQRSFATVFGRSHRQRALRNRLAGYGTPQQQQQQRITREQFTRAVQALLDEGQLDFKRRDLSILADFVFGIKSDDAASILQEEEDTLRHPSENVLGALFNLGDDRHQLVALAHDAHCRRLERKSCSQKN